MIQVALIGCGRISDKHAEAISRTEGLSLAAVCDLHEGKRSAKARAFGVESFSDTFTLLDQRPDIGLITLAIPSGAHFSAAMDLIPRKIPILIEKPLTLSHADAVQIVAKSAEHDTPVFVVKQNRLNPPVAALLDLVHSGKLGRVLSVQASVIWARHPEYYLADAWRLRRDLDGGVVWNQASHYVDLVVQILDGITFASAFGSNFLSPAESEDTVHAVLTSETNQLGSVIATTAARPKNFEGSLTVISEKGIVRVGGHALNVLERDTTGLMASQLMEYSGGDVDSVYGEGHQGVYQDILSDINGGTTESQFQASKGVAVIQLMEAIEISIREKRTVELTRQMRGGGSS